MSTVQIKDQIAYSVQSDLDLHCPQRIHVPSSVRKVLVSGIGFRQQILTHSQIYHF